MKPVKTFFVYKCKLSLALRYLADKGSNISLKLDLIVFLQNGFKYKKNSQLFLKKFSHKS